MGIEELEDIEMDEALEEASATPSRRNGKRPKPRRGLGSATTRKRRVAAEDLQKQIQDRLDREKLAARQELERLKNRSKVEAKRADQWGGNLLRTVVSNQTAVMRAFGLSQAVSSGIEGTHVNAYTDFRKVVVKWPAHRIPNRLDRTGVLDVIAQMKGVMQHEIGHLRFTTPMVDLLANATLSGRYEKRIVHTAWNMLEDMRMESLVVKAVPRIANYFGTMVANVVLNGGNLPLEQTWLMLAGREYLPKGVLRQSYTLFDQWVTDQGILNGADTWYKLVQDYKVANTEQKIIDAVEAALDFIELIKAIMPPSMDNHDQMGNGQAKPGQTASAPGSIMDLFDKKPPQKGEPGKGDGEGQGDEGAGESPTADEYDPADAGSDNGQGGKAGKADKDADGEGEGAGDGESDAPAKKTPAKQGKPNQSNHGDGSETHIEEGDLESLIEDMAQHFTEQTRRDSDVTDMARKANTSTDHVGLPEYPHEGECMSPQLQASANYTALGIEHALNSFLTDSAPTWHNRRDMGIIDPLAYRTKGVGDRDFRRELDDRGNLGLNVHVSMLCDVSGSMGGWGHGGGKSPIVALSEALYGTALACQRLDIGATYVLWSSDSQNYRVWPDGVPTPTLWPCMGGTDPTKALDDLDTHNPEEAENHLVVIFTDGAWASNFPSIQRWNAPGRTFVLVRYGVYDGDMQKDMGADKHIGINDVGLLPGELTKALVNVLNGGNGW